MTDDRGAAEPGSVDDPAAGLPDAEGPVGPATPGGADATGRGSRTGFVIAGVVAAVAVVVVVVVAVVASRPSGYSDATRDRFLRACTADGGPSVEDACRCIYDKLAATVPYDRFADVDQQLRAQLPSTPAGQPLDLPGDVRAVVESCRVVR